MLADPRSEALAQRFAGQWLRLRDVEEILPDALLYPYFDRTLGRAMMRETELFFDSLVREDRSLLDLSPPTTPSSTSGWPSTTASPTSPAPSSSA